MVERRKSLTNQFEPNFFISLSLRVILAILVVIISIFIGRLCKSENHRNVKVPKYWGVSVNKWNPQGSLRTMNRVFSNLGYELVNASNGDDWDFLWAIEYPFPRSHIHSKTKLFEPLFEMDFKFLPHQRVNHIPGMFHITNKESLGVNSKSKFLLPTFTFPEKVKDFNEFVEKNPNSIFVEKNYGNRGVRIVKNDEIIFDESEKIYQKFLDNPFLIDGHAFDLGVYVLITSINPLRIYRYDHEIFLRFCPEEFYPFDPSITDKYAVKGNHLCAYEMDSFEELFEDYGYSLKQIFELVVGQKGFDVENLWRRIEDAIVSIVLQNEYKFIHEVNKDFNFSHNFFELVRFDFIFDEKLNPYIVEINMSPNLTPTEEVYEEHALIYEQLVYNTLQIIGGGSYYEMLARVSNDTIVTNFRNIAVDIHQCSKNDCINDCENPSCILCLPCLNQFMLFQMLEAYREHMKKGNFKRVFPSTADYDDEEIITALSKNNQIMLKWFKSKCEMDSNWC